MTTLRPGNQDELRDAVAWAAAERQSLEITAGGGPTGIGRPVAAQHVLDLSGIVGIVSYQPEELVLTVNAGTSLDEIEAVLAQRGQFLAFEPPRFGGATSGTIGGIVATGFSGPRRFKMGAVRDHLLGVAAVSGRGETFVSGGKVIKNVTGYDLPKLLAGSHGTLAAMHEVTLKVLPAPEDLRTLLILGLDATAAVRLISAALQTSAEISGASFLPGDLAFPEKPPGFSVTALRLEGFRLSVDDRLASLQGKFQSADAQRVLDREASTVLWRSIRDVLPFAGDPHGVVWRISVPPAQGAAVLGRLSQTLPGSRAYLDWAGGLIWLMLASADPQAEVVRNAFHDCGGHAMLFRAPEAVRAAAEVFQPQTAPLAALARRVKQQFDPNGVLNPGRMYAGA